MRKLLQTPSAPSPPKDPPPPPDSSSSPSPPPPASSSPPPVRRSAPPVGGNSTRYQPPPQKARDESLSRDQGQSESETVSFSWQASKNRDIVHQRAIIGSAVGVGLFFTMIMIICLWSCRRKRRREERKRFYQEKYSGGSYYHDHHMASQGHWQHQHTTSYMDPKSRTPPPPPYRDGKNRTPPPPNYKDCQNRTPPPPNYTMSTEHWTAAAPPPPPNMSSSEMNSSGFFGGPPLPPPNPWSGYNQGTFTYNELAAATNGFAQANLLGQGGFGYVHKGVLPNGKEVAVKSLKMNSGQGEREFQAEVDIISRVHHRHLVSLVGYCIYGTQRMLVYEYVPNSTLEEHLHGAGRPCMDCTTRIKIALGAAKGFAYLHEDCHPRIIHRDIKAANILLDNNNEAKVADFGLAKLSSETNTHVSTRIMGTFGYLAPEYASSGKLTEKSDVYSFGIVLLELITGRRPIDVTRDDDDDTLVDWARPILMRVAEGGSFEELVDPRLENNYDHGEMLRMISSAAACIRPSSRRRPKMSQVVRALEGDVSLDDLHEGMKALRGSLSSSSSELDLQRYQRGGGSDTGSECSVSQSSGSNSRELTRFSPGPGP